MRNYKQSLYFIYGNEICLGTPLIKLFGFYLMSFWSGINQYKKPIKRLIPIKYCTNKF